MPYTDAILAALSQGKRSARDVSIAAVGHESAIRSLKRGLDLRASTIQALCEALGLEFYVGPPRDEAATPEIADATPDVAPDWAMEMQEGLQKGLQGSLQAELAELKAELAPAALSEDLSALRKDLKEDRANLRSDLLLSMAALLGKDREPEAAAAIEPVNDDAPALDEEELAAADTRILALRVGDPASAEEQIAHSAEILRVPYVRDVRAAAGPGEETFDEAEEFEIAFNRSILPDWVDFNGLICIRTTGDSMEPTLYENDLLLVDHSQIEPVADQIFVVRAEDGMVVKRLKQAGRGWRLISDNSAYPPRKVGKEDWIIGRVAWSGPLEKRV